MNVPMSDRTSASSKLRKSGVRSGRHGLDAPRALGFSLSDAGFNTDPGDVGVGSGVYQAART
jgi:hypothetical protein